MKVKSRMSRYREDTQNISLCEALDRILNKGAVIRGDVMVSVAGIDLLYVGLNLMVSSIETACQLTHQEK